MYISAKKYTPVSERGGHDGRGLAVRLQRAELKVKVQRVGDASSLAGKTVVFLHVIGQRVVPVRRQALGQKTKKADPFQNKTPKSGNPQIYGEPYFITNIYNTKN